MSDVNPASTPEAAPAEPVVQAAPEAAAEAAAVVEDTAPPAPDAAAQGPAAPLTPAAPPAARVVGAGTVPVFPNGKPMLDAAGNPVSDKSRLVAALLCWFLGYFGAHRFYVGKPGTAVLMIVTLGGLGIWVLIDVIVILVGSFRDKSGKALQNW